MLMISQCLSFDKTNKYYFYYQGKGLTNDLGTDSEKLLFNTIDNSILKRVKSKMFHFKVYQDSKPNLYYQLLHLLSHQNNHHL